MTYSILPFLTFLLTLPIERLPLQVLPQLIDIRVIGSGDLHVDRLWPITLFYIIVEVALCLLACLLNRLELEAANLVIALGR